MTIANFKRLLDEQHEWPCRYTFKFIVPLAGLPDACKLFPDETPVIRPSAKGKFVSVTFNPEMPSSDAVIDVYDQASRIDQIVSL